MGGLGGGDGPKRAEEVREPIEKQKGDIVNKIFDMNDRMKGFTGALEESM